MKIDLTTGTWQDNPGCPINITLVSTSDVYELSKLAQASWPKPKLDNRVELAETPKPFLVVCVRGLLCCAASPAIASNNIQNCHADQFEANDSNWRTAGSQVCPTGLWFLQLTTPLWDWILQSE